MDNKKRSRKNSKSSDNFSNNKSKKNKKNEENFLGQINSFRRKPQYYHKKTNKVSGKFKHSWGQSDVLPPNLPRHLPPPYPWGQPDDLPPNLPRHLPPQLPHDLPPNLPRHLPPQLPHDLPPNLPRHLPPQLPFSPNKSIKKINIKFPKTLILHLAIHGCHIHENYNELNSFKLPIGMKLKYIKAAKTGIPGMTHYDQWNDETNNEVFQKIIEANTKGLLNKKTRAIMINTIMDEIKYENKDNFTIDENNVKAKKMLKLEVDSEEEDYVKNYDKFFTVQKYDSTHGKEARILNKIFSKETRPDKQIYRLTKILIMNIEGYPDLFDFFKKENPEHDENNIYLEDLINFCKDKGSKHIIIFDFSCSVYRDSHFNKLNIIGEDFAKVFKKGLNEYADRYFPERYYLSDRESSSIPDG